jgi:abortive infection bacteriophage resistance protein
LVSVVGRQAKSYLKPDTNIETVFNLYKFDRELHKLIISELEKIEIAVRAKMAYVLSTTHNPF